TRGCECARTSHSQGGRWFYSAQGSESPAISKRAWNGAILPQSTISPWYVTTRRWRKDFGAGPSGADQASLLILGNTNGSTSGSRHTVARRRPFDSWIPPILMKKLPLIRLNYGSMRSSETQSLEHVPPDIRPIRNKNHAISHSTNHSDN